MRPPRRSRPRARSATSSPTASTAAGSRRIRPGRPGAPARTAYAHSFVLLAAAVRRDRGREPASGVARGGGGGAERAGSGRRTNERVPGGLGPALGAARALPRCEREHAHGRGVPGRRRRDRRSRAWYDRALRIAERLIDGVARAHDWRSRGALRRGVASAARLQRRPSRGTRSGRSASRRATASSGRGCCCRCAPASPDPPGLALEAARGLFARATADGWQESGGFVYTTDHDGRPVVSDRCTGSSRRPSAPPPPCTP